MSALIYLIPLALLLGLTGLSAFVWSLKSGQYDDIEGASRRILLDDDDPDDDDDDDDEDRD
ncbi:MAG: cbb3-type cytochrome oxidase assembly protein CcoS [Alphaproteobacteria bacterium]|nr:cbb3-type cytochrome oxidase assembly protein CcoS [Alphaproteobacteria bacterium]